MSSTLYIVATPIGNLEDISQRALTVLRQVDRIFAEDTRHSTKLLQHYAISTPMQAYHEFSSEAQTENVFQCLYQGKSVALISDAGTPLISDPGFRLVQRAHQEGITVVPIAGACAAVVALCSSGLPTDRFTFEGFLPAKTKARLDALQSLENELRTMVFYEAPHRLVESLTAMVEVFGEQRLITMARELSKTFETIKQAPLLEMLEWVRNDTNQQRGEIVLVLQGKQVLAQESLNDEAKRLVALLLPELSPNRLSKVVAEYCQLPKKVVYDYILSLKN